MTQLSQFAIPILLLAAPFAWAAQPGCATTHLTIFDSNLAEFFEERTFDLQSGPNRVEWRSLLPLAYIRTVRISAPDRVTVVRQDITYDGPEVRGQKSPVVHLVVQNGGAAGPHKLSLDYLTPGLSWKADYSMALNPPGESGTPEGMKLDGWVTVQNDTSADICAASVDLVAGDVQLLMGNSSMARTYSGNSQVPNLVGMVPQAGEVLADVKGMSVFSRFRLGHDISMTANSTIGRFPLFQALKLPVEERHIFENEATGQTVDRGGFLTAPRGLEVRLVSRNLSRLPFPSGMVTIYSQDEEAPQVVGQDQVVLTAEGADFSVTQGRSNTLQGTRRVLSRTEVGLPGTYKLVTQMEVVITNRGDKATTAFIREGVDNFGKSWTVTTTNYESRRLADRHMEFQVPVRAHDSTTLVYTVECQ